MIPNLCEKCQLSQGRNCPCSELEAMPLDRKMLRRVALAVVFVWVVAFGSMYLLHS